MSKLKQTVIDMEYRLESIENYSINQKNESKRFK